MKYRKFWLWYSGLAFIYCITLCIVAVVQDQTTNALIDGTCAMINGVLYLYWLEQY
jgi:hypothetical protein